jgi:hypothetical protein
MQTLLLACRSCGASIDPGPRASLAKTGRVLLDAACGGCGRRALFELGP